MRTALALLVLAACGPATTVAPVYVRNGQVGAAGVAAHVLEAEGYEVDSATSDSVTSTWREYPDGAGATYMARWSIHVSATMVAVNFECKINGRTCARVPHAGRWQEQADDIASRLGS